MHCSRGITFWRTSFCRFLDTGSGTTATGAVTGTVIGEAMDAMVTGAAMVTTIGGVTIMTDIMAAMMVMGAAGMPSATTTVNLTGVRPIASTLRTGLTAASATETVQEDRDGQTLPRREAPGRFTTGVLM